eukprot:SAG31_NODE_70_length_28117_cov_100.521843_7_plen_80_part_00
MSLQLISLCAADSHEVVTGSYEQMRYDRILARLPPSDSTPGYAWQPSAIGLFGTDPCVQHSPLFSSVINRGRAACDRKY